MRQRSLDRHITAHFGIKICPILIKYALEVKFLSSNLKNQFRYSEEAQQNKFFKDLAQTPDRNRSKLFFSLQNFYVSSVSNFTAQKFDHIVESHILSVNPQFHAFLLQGLEYFKSHNTIEQNVAYCVRFWWVS